MDILQHTTATSFSSYQKSRGATLIVSLILLLVVTMIAVSSIQSSTMQTKMSKNAALRQTVFQTAEAGLAEAESAFIANYAVSDTNMQNCISGSVNCFESTCAGGYCFEGIYPPGSPNRADCQLTKLNPLEDPVWMRSTLDVWKEGSGKHRVALVTNNKGYPDPKYVVEFLCYIDRPSSVSTNCSTNPSTECSALFRFTTLAVSPDDQVKVMLQSTLSRPVN